MGYYAKRKKNRYWYHPESESWLQDNDPSEMVLLECLEISEEEYHKKAMNKKSLGGEIGKHDGLKIR